MRCAADKHARAALKWEKPLPAEKLKPDAQIFIHPVCFAGDSEETQIWLALPLTPLFTLPVFASAGAAVSVGIHGLSAASRSGAKHLSVSA